MLYDTRIFRVNMMIIQMVLVREKLFIIITGVALIFARFYFFNKNGFTGYF